MYKPILIACAAALLAAPAAAGEKWTGLLAAVVHVPGGLSPIGSTKMVGLVPRAFKSREACMKEAARWNAKRKVKSAGGQFPYKRHILCYPKSAKTLTEVTLGICGVADPVYRSVCTYLVYTKPHLRRVRPRR